MDSSILVLGLILVIVFVRYDLMLFAVFAAMAIGLYFLVKGFGRAGSSLKSPIEAIKEDLSLDAKDIEHAHGSYPGSSYLKGVWGNFVDFLVNDHRKRAKKVDAHGKAHGPHAGHAEHKGSH